MLDLPQKYDWPDHAVDELCKLWADGHSCTKIAEIMGRGLTKNSIIGKVSKLKLPQRRKSVPRTGLMVPTAPRPFHGNRSQPKAQAIVAAAKARKSAPAILPYDVEDNLDAVDVTALVGILDLKAHHCRWISGDPKAAHGYCGAQVKPSSSYCPEHHARVYPGQRP